MEKNLFEALNQQLHSVTAELYAQHTRLERQMTLDDNQICRRIYAKSFFSIIEAQLSFLERQIKLTRENEYIPLSDNEEQILYGKGGTNKMESLSFTERATFLLNLFLEVNYSHAGIDSNSENWKGFTRLVSIRNKLTFTDAEITKEEIQTCKKAFDHFQDLFQETRRTAAQTLLRIAKNLEKNLDNASDWE